MQTKQNMQEEKHAILKDMLDSKFRKLEKYFDSIGQRELFNTVKDNMYFAGGCIREMVLGNKPKDYDIFFTNKKIVDHFKLTITLDGLKDFKMYNKKYGTYTVIIDDEIYQFITMVSGEAYQVVAKFDFTVNSNWYLPSKRYLYICSTHQIHKKELHCNSEVTTPYAAMRRVSYFLKKGYTISGPELIKLTYKCGKENAKSEYDAIQMSGTFSGGEDVPF